MSTIQDSCSSWLSLRSPYPHTPHTLMHTPHWSYNSPSRDHLPFPSAHIHAAALLFPLTMPHRVWVIHSVSNSLPPTPIVCNYSCMSAVSLPQSWNTEGLEGRPFCPYLQLSHWFYSSPVWLTTTRTQKILWVTIKKIVSGKKDVILMMETLKDSYNSNLYHSALVEVFPPLTHWLIVNSCLPEMFHTCEWNITWWAVSRTAQFVIVSKFLKTDSILFSHVSLISSALVPCASCVAYFRCLCAPAHLIQILAVRFCSIC